MGLSKLTLGLSLLGILTTTWARSIAEHREEMKTRREQSDNSIERYSNEKNNRETIVGSEIENEMDEAYDDYFIRRYAKSEAEKFLRENRREGGKARRSLHVNDEKVPFSTRRLEKMLEKAILKIITGDLNTADMLLLKSLNYSLEEVLAIRERELNKKNDFHQAPNIGTKIYYEKKINDDLTESSRINQLENHDTSTATPEFDFDAYNRQAIYDYESASNKMSSRTLDLDSIESNIDEDDRSNDNEAETNDDIHKSFDRAIEPHVVFKIRYDDSEFDSSSNERAKQLSRERAGRLTTKNHGDDIGDDRTLKKNIENFIPLANGVSTVSGIPTTPFSNGINTFQASNVNVPSSFPVDYRLDNLVTPYDDFNARNSIEMGNNDDERNMIDATMEDTSSISTETSIIVETSGSTTPKFDKSDDFRRKSIYEGLEWVEDDVYRVIPEAFDSSNFYDAGITEMENETIDDSTINETNSLEIKRRNNDNDNDTIGYQNEDLLDEPRTKMESGDEAMRNSPNFNLSTYQQLALAHRREGNITSSFDSQGQKAIEDIKLKVLAMTGRFNLSSNGNQVQRERLTMFPPICQLPKNTDVDAWSDPFLMNMNFQLNLTSDDHVVAAKVRIYALPQNNITATTGGTTEEEDEEEKKIRISIYFYTKSLKKHRSKKRLIDSIVISLSSQGSHWALDVRQALRFWRQNLRNSHSLSNNHGLVIQVEDQDGKSLKPSQYIQQDSCHASEINDDEKAYQRVPALFVQACSRYVRVVNGAPVTYVNCSKSSRNGRH